MVAEGRRRNVVIKILMIFIIYLLLQCAMTQNTKQNLSKRHNRKFPLQQEFAMREFCVCLALECLVIRKTKHTTQKKIIDNNNKNNVLNANREKKTKSSTRN